LELERIIKRYKKSKGKSLLDVGCGTGKHLQHFKEHYKCTGVDLNKQMLAIAKKTVKGVVFRQADIVHLNLDQKFNVILCMFSVIGYVKTLSNLKKTISNFARHLAPGGVLLVHPWLAPQDYKVGFPHMTTYDSPELKIARLTVSELQSNSMSRMVMHHLVAEKNKPVSYFTDVHDMGLFETKQTLLLLKDAGLQARFIKQGSFKQRGLFVATQAI
jgi:ubiquinone/menaquinone biosynthesis C-methylase UbiE